MAASNQAASTPTTDKFRRYTRTPAELLYDVSKSQAVSQQPRSNALQPVDLNATYVASNNVNNLPDLKEESMENGVHNGTFAKDSSSKENNIMNDTFVVDNTVNAKSNATFVLEKPPHEKSPSRTNSKPNSPVDKVPDRMTQSLHVENHATNGSATTVIRKASFNGPVDLNRVPSAPSLK